jgi:hypothetical protein
MKIIKYILILLFGFCFQGCSPTSNPKIINEDKNVYLILNQEIKVERKLLGFVHKYTLPKGKYKALITSDEGIYYVAPNVILINDSSPQPYGGLFVSNNKKFGVWFPYPHSYLELFNSEELYEKQLNLEKNIIFSE